MALRACVDAGTQKNVFCVAAVAFGYDRAVKAAREWDRVLSGRTFHMTDLHARQCEFEGIEKDEVDAIMKGAVSIIRRYASFAVAVSCDAALVADALPVVADKHPDMKNLLSAMKSIYGLMCHFGMSALGRHANNDGPGRQISYVFEQGDEGQGGLRKYLEFLDPEQQHHRLLLNNYSFNRLTVADKKEIEGIFHASDLLAWEWARHVTRDRAGKPIRGSLAEMAEHTMPYHDANGLTIRNGRKLYCRHFPSERLTAIAGFFGDTLAANSTEEVDAAFNRYRKLYPGGGMEESLESLRRGY